MDDYCSEKPKIKIFRMIIFAFSFILFASCSMTNDPMIDDIKSYIQENKSTKIDVTTVVKKHLHPPLKPEELTQKLKDSGFDIFIDKSKPEKSFYIATQKYRGSLDFFSYNEIRIIYEENFIDFPAELNAFHINHGL